MPVKRVSMAAIERHETYRKRMSVVSGVGIGNVIHTTSVAGGGTRIHPIQEL